MILAFKITLILSLLGIAYQDIKTRLVSIWLYLLSGISFAILHFFTIGKFNFLINVTFNLILITFYILIYAAFVKWRKPELKFLEVIGLGDLIFFLLLTVSFATIAFTILFVFSLIASLCIDFFISRKRNKKETHAPLAGYMSIFYIAVMIAHWSGIYDDLYVL